MGNSKTTMGGWQKTAGAARSSATQTGFVECISFAKNRQVVFIAHQRAGAASFAILVYRLAAA